MIAFMYSWLLLNLSFDPKALQRHLCHWVPSGVPEKQARRSAIVTHALRGAWGETLALERALQVGAARPHPSVRGLSGLPKRSPVAPGCRMGDCDDGLSSLSPAASPGGAGFGTSVGVG